MSDTTPRRELKLDPRFLIDRQGKQFVLFQGVLDLAHQDGLKRVETTIIQVGTEENGMTWIVRAVVETDRGTFTGHGDASPVNVARAMLTVLPRFAETRAVARALRFATNIGTAAIEELGDDDQRDHAPREPQSTTTRPTQSESTPAQSDNARPSSTQPSDGGPTATPAQVRAMYSIADALGIAGERIDQKSREKYGVVPAELTRKQASDWITALKAQQNR